MNISRGGIWSLWAPKSRHCGVPPATGPHCYTKCTVPYTAYVPSVSKLNLDNAFSVTRQC